MTMAKITDELSNDPSLNESDAFEGLEDDDYVFVIGSDGKMKNIIFPPSPDFEYSADLLALFRLLGVNDPDELLGATTLH